MRGCSASRRFYYKRIGEALNAARDGFIAGVGSGFRSCFRAGHVRDLGEREQVTRLGCVEHEAGTRRTADLLSNAMRARSGCYAWRRCARILVRVRRWIRFPWGTACSMDPRAATPTFGSKQSGET